MLNAVHKTTVRLSSIRCWTTRHSQNDWL